MYDLTAITTLEKIYQNRSLDFHNEAADAKKIAMDNELHFHIILNSSTSKKILKSEDFHVFNYFKEGVENLKNKNCDVELMNRFMNASPMFKNGNQHVELKKEVFSILNQQLSQLDTFSPVLTQHFLRRHKKYKNVYRFGRTLVDFVFSKVAADLLDISFISAYRILRRHENIFFFYFHVLRQKKLLGNLQALSDKSNAEESLDAVNVMLVQSLMIMGRDPLVTAICISVVEGETDLSKAINRYFPIAETKRVCFSDTQVDGIFFNKGDIVSVNLLPAKDESAQQNLGFGSGIHLCTGKRLVNWVLQLAEEILKSEDYADMDKNVKGIQEGALLLYKETL